MPNRACANRVSTQPQMLLEEVRINVDNDAFAAVILQRQNRGPWNPIGADPNVFEAVTRHEEPGFARAEPPDTGVNGR
ncbi:hypothetical protein [Bradyrhizobium sp. ORS 111]|uniref:hypothetical protein n=1 Tax=Bradyrhizobium sp. ORS 111 TaxID=1685958 RepID=UPI00388D8D62